MKSHAEHTTPKLKSQFQLTPSDLIVLFDSTVKLNEAVAPRCRCGEYENIQGGWAAGNIIWYCPVCRADEEQR